VHVFIAFVYTFGTWLADGIGFYKAYLLLG